MPEALFDVVFAGVLAEGVTPDLARARLKQAFRLDDERCAALVSGRRVTVKRAVDADTAARLLVAFRDAGAIAELVPLDEPETIIAAPPPDAPLATELSAEAAAGLSLAPPGAPLDEIDDRVPIPFPDVSQLSLTPGPEWTLADCAPPPLPVPVFDLDDWELLPMSEPRERAADFD